jgi:hypothetical protein
MFSEACFLCPFLSRTVVSETNAYTLLVQI